MQNFNSLTQRERIQDRAPNRYPVKPRPLFLVLENRKPGQYKSLSPAVEINGSLFWDNEHIHRRTTPAKRPYLRPEANKESGLLGTSHLLCTTEWCRESLQNVCFRSVASKPRLLFNERKGELKTYTSPQIWLKKINSGNEDTSAVFHCVQTSVAFYCPFCSVEPVN